MKKRLNKLRNFLLIVTILDLLVTFRQFLKAQTLYINIGDNKDISMGLTKVGLNLGKEIIAWTRTAPSRSLLATKPVKVNIDGLKLAKPLSTDTVQISNNSLLQKVLGIQTAEKELYDVTKWQKEFFAKKYDTLKTPEERAAYIGKLRLVFEKIKTKKDDEIMNFTNNDDMINFIRENFQYLHHKNQSKIIKLLENNELPNEYFPFDFDNNKMFELVLKDKKYNLEFIDKLMKRSLISSRIDSKVHEFSQIIDKNLSQAGIKLSKSKVNDIPQQLNECEINKALYHDAPYYHGVRGGDEEYKMNLFKRHGSSRFGPINSTGTNVLFTTGSLEYAERYGGPNVLKMYLRKDYPIINHNIIEAHSDDWKEERLIYDLLYEKGIKFLKNGRETLIIDPKAVTFVSDFKNNYIP